MPNNNMYMPNAYNRPGTVIPNRQQYAPQQFRDGPDNSAMQFRFLNSAGVLPHPSTLQPRPVQPGFIPPPGMGNEMRNGLRRDLGLPPVPQRMQAPPANAAPQGVGNPGVGPLRQIAYKPPQGLPPVTQTMQAQPAVGQYPVTPQEQARHDAMLAGMNQQQDFLRSKDKAYQQNQWYEGAVEGMHSDADVMAMMRPDADTHGVSSQQYFDANPSSMASHYSDRFNAINTNRQLRPQEIDPPPVAQSQFNERMQGRGVPPPVMAQNESTTPLTPQQALELSSMGLSPREWQAKQAWAKKNGITDWNSEAATKYREQVTDPRLQAEDARRQQYRDRLHNESMQNMERRNQRLAMGFQRQNIGLFTGGADNTMAQLYNNLNGSSIPMQQQGLTPAQQVNADLQNRNIQLQRADLANSRGDIDQSERIDRTIDQPYMGGSVGGQVGAYGKRPMTPMQAFQSESPIDQKMAQRNAIALRDPSSGELKHSEVSAKLSTLMSDRNVSGSQLVNSGLTPDVLEQFIRAKKGWGFEMNASDQMLVNQAEDAIALIQGSKKPEAKQAYLPPVPQQMRSPVQNQGILDRIGDHLNRSYNSTHDFLSRGGWFR